MTVLILGGTGEARDLAAGLVAADVSARSSLAGRVRDPAMPDGEVIVGGFGGADGLARYLIEHQITALIDATHPFAATISSNATVAAERAAVPLLRLQRPPWQATPDDRWLPVAQIQAAATAVGAATPDSATVFLTTGRRDVAAFAADSRRHYLIRSVDPPEVDLPLQHELILDRGPYRVDGERDLMRRHDVTVLVTKNSGGTMTYAKIVAARELGIPVVIVSRPAPPEGRFDSVADTAAALRWCLNNVQARQA